MKHQHLKITAFTWIAPSDKIKGREGFIKKAIIYALNTEGGKLATAPGSTHIYLAVLEHYQGIMPTIENQNVLIERAIKTTLTLIDSLRDPALVTKQFFNAAKDFHSQMFHPSTLASKKIKRNYMLPVDL